MPTGDKQKDPQGEQEPCAGFSVTRLTVNVGVTGHRKSRLPNEGKDGCLDEVIRSILEHIKKTTEHLHREGRGLFARFDHDEAPRLRVISALAEGVDRMAAERGLELGYELQCPLPNRCEVYKKSFEYPEDTPQFCKLLAQATSIFEIDGSNSESSQAYADASRVMMHHSDLLIAVWDGKKTKYIAGTYATMQEARSKHIPILYVPVGAQGDDEVIMFLDTESHRNWRAAIDEYLAEILLPPDSVRFLSEKEIPEAAYRKRTTTGVYEKLESFLLMSLSGRKNSRSRVGNTLAGAVSATAGEEKMRECAIGGLSDGKWGVPKKCFSALGGYYADAYHRRAFYRYLLPLLAVLALIFATYVDYPLYLTRFFGGAARGYAWVLPTVFYVAQVLLLGWGIVLVFAENSERKHVRYYSSRYLAERCRQSIYLWPMGFCNVRYLPRRHIETEESLPTGGSEKRVFLVSLMARWYRKRREALSQDTDHKDFPFWYYRMLAREAGLPDLKVGSGEMADWLNWLKSDFIKNQKRYHDKRRLKNFRLEARVHLLGLGCLGFGLAATVVQAYVYISEISCNRMPPVSLWQAVVIGAALFLPSLATFWASYANMTGYATHFAVSQGMREYFRLLETDVDFLLANASGSKGMAGKMRFNGELCYTDILDLCERIDSACMDEVTDWESSMRKHCLTYI